MTLINNRQKIIWKVVDKRVGWFARRTAVKIARIIFDATAKPHLSHHFKVIRNTLTDTLRLKRFPLFGEVINGKHAVFFNLVKRALHTLLSNRIVRCWEDGNIF